MHNVKYIQFDLFLIISISRVTARLIEYVVNLIKTIELNNLI